MQLLFTFLRIFIVTVLLGFQKWIGNWNILCQKKLISHGQMGKKFSCDSCFLMPIFLIVFPFQFGQRVRKAEEHPVPARAITLAPKMLVFLEKSSRQGGASGGCSSPVRWKWGFFSPWKINFLWFSISKFKIFRACGAYWHRRRIFLSEWLSFLAKNL